MDMSLFRHNHARFIGIDIVAPEFMRANGGTFNFDAFKAQIAANWTNESANRPAALKMVCVSP